MRYFVNMGGGATYLNSLTLPVGNFLREVS